MKHNMRRLQIKGATWYVRCERILKFNGHAYEKTTRATVSDAAGTLRCFFIGSPGVNSWPSLRDGIVAAFARPEAAPRAPTDRQLVVLHLIGAGLINRLRSANGTRRRRNSDRHGRHVEPAMIESCISNGWAIRENASGAQAPPCARTPAY